MTGPKQCVSALSHNEPNRNAVLTETVAASRMQAGCSALLSDALGLHEPRFVRPLVADGGWATELQIRGLALGECADAWNLSHPGEVRAVAAAYRDAGAHLLLTNTFQANAISLAAFGLANAVKEVNLAGARLSLDAAAGLPVFGSMGPAGRLFGGERILPQDLYRAFADQASALAAAGVAGVVLESMSDLEETQAAIDAVRTTALPLIVSFAFHAGPEQDRTMSGVTPEQAARFAEEAGADATGANCGNGIEQMVFICRRLRSTTVLPLWIKPNAGIPVLRDSHIVYPVTAAEFAAYVPALRAAGANFIGGCCGTTPEFVRSIAGVLNPCD